APRVPRLPQVLLTILFAASYCVLQVDGDRRDLHSFPTRRSSDLGRVHVEKVRPLEPELFSQNYPRGIPGVKKSVGKFPRRKNMRSEEHTSELQSRENLVCRLLLEKKNEMTLISRAVTWKQSSSSD